jgi:hypothetical protein
MSQAISLAISLAKSLPHKHESFMANQEFERGNSFVQREPSRYRRKPPPTPPPDGDSSVNEDVQDDSTSWRSWHWWVRVLLSEPRLVRLVAPDQRPLERYEFESLEHRDPRYSGKWVF